MENTEMLTEQPIQSLTLTQRALNAFDAWCGIQVGQQCLKFRQEMSRVLGIYIEDPTQHTATIEGIQFSLNVDKGCLMAWIFAEEGEIYKQDIKQLSDLGDLIQQVHEDAFEQDEPLILTEDPESKYAGMFESAPEYIARAGSGSV
jgi:hypothetical protein